MILLFKIFQIPFADAIISSLHFSSQNKKTSVLVFFKILTRPTISSPTLDVPIIFYSNEMVTQGEGSADLCAAEPEPASIKAAR